MIAVDVMGGDFAPHAILKGALQAAQADVPVMLFGPEKLLQVELDKLDNTWRNYPILLTHASDQIKMTDNPVLAVKRKRDSSLVKAVASVKEQRCRGVISAGNSGALMVAATIILGRAQNVERPAIAGLLPGTKGNVIGLDLGANVSCRPQHLLQFAHMGAGYAKEVLGIEKARIALLANGQEEGKGSELVKEAYKLLKNDTSLNFIGNVEPCHVLTNQTDVVVCDGFSGNIFVKTMESMHAIMTNFLHKQFSESTQSINKFVEKLEQKFSYRKEGGATLLGVDGRVVVCHGNSDAFAIDRAIRFASGTLR